MRSQALGGSALGREGEEGNQLPRCSRLCAGRHQTSSAGDRGCLLMRAPAAQCPPALCPWLQAPPQTVQGSPRVVLGNKFLPIFRFPQPGGERQRQGPKSAPKFNL